MSRGSHNTQPEEKEQKKPINKDNLKKLLRLFRYTLPYRVQFVLGLLALLLSTATLLAFPYITGTFFDTTSNQFEGVVFGIFNDVEEVVALLLGIFFLQGVFSYFRVYLFSVVNDRAMASLRSDLYKKFVTLPIAFFDTNRTGDLISRITADIGMLQETFSTTLAELLR